MSLTVNSSTTSDAYSAQSYSASSNDNNTLSITSYFQLLATQMANQDITDPMDNSEMLSSMSQMAMVQSLTSMTEAITNQTAFSTTSFAVSMIGKEVHINSDDGEVTGIVETVDLSGDAPKVKLQGKSQEYDYTSIISISEGGSQDQENE